MLEKVPARIDTTQCRVSLLDSNGHYMKFLPFLLLALCSLSIHATVRVEFTVAEPASVARSNEIVVSGVPFPEGALARGAALHVETAQGRALPTQTRVLGTWPDGSVKWVLVQFPASVEAGKQVRYFLVQGAAPLPAQAIHIDETPGAVLVSTGAMQVSISRRRFELLGAVSRGGREVLRGSPISFELANGVVHDSLRAVPDSIVVEDRGPVRATVKVGGWLLGPNGEKHYRIESRLRFFAGQTTVEGNHTFTVLGGEKLHQIRRISYDLMPAALATPGSGRPEGEWAILGNLGVAIRDFRHLGPNVIEPSATRLRIGILSPNGGAVLRFGRGRAKTHRILYDFAPTPERLTAFASPLIATTSPEYFCSTNAFMALSPSGAPETREYDEKIKTTFDYLRRVRETDPRESGLQHFGDYYHGGYDNRLTRGNLEYDTAHALFLHYARSGDRQFYDYAVQCNQHFIDMDVNHETGEQLFHGYSEKADIHERINTRLEWGHIFTDGPADAWVLTGDERSLEALKGIADNTSTIADGEGFEKLRRILSSAERHLGWPLLALCRAYEVTGDRKYLEASRKIVAYLKLYSADPMREYANGTWWRSWMMDGGKTFMVGALHEGLGAYYDLTQDRELVPVIVKSLNWLIDYMWVPETGSFVYEYNAMNRGHRFADSTLNMMVVDAFRSGYEITGDERYLAVALHAFRSRVREIKPPQDGKYFTIDARTSPHTAAFLWRKRLVPDHLPTPPQPKRRPAAQRGAAAILRPEILLKADFENNLEYTSPEGTGSGQSVGHIAFVPGHKGLALALAKSGRAWLPAPANLLSAPGAVELWVRLNHKPSRATPSQRTIFHIEGKSPLTDSLALVTIYDELRVRMKDEIGTLNGTADSDVTAWNPGEWHHVALVWNHECIRLYLDGKLQVRPDEGKVLWDNVNGLTTGPQTRINLGWRFGNWLGDSTIDELTVFGRELAADEIAKRFAEQSRPAAEPRVIKVTDYGATGDGRALSTKSIQRALDDCTRLGGGRVVFPHGVYISGTLHLRSNVSLSLEKGAVLKGSSRLDDYLEPLTHTPGDKSHFVATTASRRLFLYGDRLHNVTIEGEGTIDGDLVPEADGGRGPLTIFIQHSSGVTIRDVTVTRAPGWAVTFFDCRRVRILGAHVTNVRCDGINPVSCQDVLYDGAVIEGTGDDPLCIKNEGPPLPGGYVTRDIVVRNTTIRNTGHPAFKIGTGTNGVFDNILIEDCVIDLTGDLFAIQLMRPSLAGETERHIRNVTLRRLDVRNAGRVIDVTVMGVERPVISGLHVSGIRFRGAAIGSRIRGTSASPVRDIHVDTLDVEARKGAPAWLELAYVEGFTLNESTLKLPGTATAVDARNCRRLAFTQLQLSGIQGAEPLFRFDEVQDARVRAIDVPSAEKLVYASGASSRNIRIDGIIPAHVKIPIMGSGEVADGALHPAAQAEVSEFSAPAVLAPDATVVAVVRARSRNSTGAARVSVLVDGIESGASWAWLSPAEATTVNVQGAPLYQPRAYKLRVGNQSRKVRIRKSPAQFRFGDYCQIEAPRRDNSLVRVSVTVQNIGSTRGAERVELKSGTAVLASKQVTLNPGERGEVTFEQAVPGGVFQVADFPEWRLRTFSNVPARFLLYRDKIAVETQGRAGAWNDYAMVYLPAIEGDFDAQVRLLRGTEHTGEYAAAGLIVRNRLDDIHSAGLSLHFRVPKYGAYKIWAWDADGDGEAEVRSDGGHAQFPVWYRFEKRGQTLRAFSSSDGESWRVCGQTGRQQFTSPHIDRTQDVGFYATAWNDRGEFARVEFSDFTVKRLP